MRRQIALKIHRAYWYLQVCIVHPPLGRKLRPSGPSSTGISAKRWHPLCSSRSDAVRDKDGRELSSSGYFEKRWSAMAALNVVNTSVKLPSWMSTWLGTQKPPWAMSHSFKSVIFTITAIFALFERVSISIYVISRMPPMNAYANLSAHCSSQVLWEA